MGLDEWYENPYLVSVYREGHQGINPTYPESRISLLYSLWKEKTMPWTWDHQHYMLDNEDMIGFFYPEDFNTMLQISEFESQRKK
jgi:hypothetical protein